MIKKDFLWGGSAALAAGFTEFEQKVTKITKGGLVDWFNSFDGPEADFPEFGKMILGKMIKEDFLWGRFSSFGCLVSRV